MSTASVQSIVAPTVAPSRNQEFSAAKIDDPRDSIATDSSKKTDFRTLLNNSQEEIRKERLARENGDLSGAKNDAEFLEKLAEQTKEKRMPKGELGKDDFLKLFVTQLQNQNPLNPEADTEMAAKLAQFNGLEQMMNVNKSLEKMLSEQNNSRNLQMVNYVGRDVVVDGGRVRVSNGKPSQSDYKIENDVAQSTLEVRNTAGILVHQIDLGPANAGGHTLKWDGKDANGKAIPDGTYTLSINARNMDGNSVPVAMTSKVRVTGVDINNKDGGLFSEFGRIKMEQIKSVGIAGFDHTMTEDAISTAPATPNTGETPAAASKGELALDKNMSESLDRLKAEGKLDLANPTPSSQASAKKPIDQAPRQSAKLMDENQENGSTAMPVTAKSMPKTATAAVP